MSTALLVFARAPVPGRAKTRLIPVLGRKGAAALHAAMVEDTLIRACAAAVGPVSLWAADDDPDGFLAQCARTHELPLRRQRGGDLGVRMQQALSAVLAEHAGPAMVIGCDCPALMPATIRDAAHALDAHDAVVVPATDGGYVLLGMRIAPWSLFSGLEWGGDRVLAGTRERLAALDWRWRELAPHPDIDRPEDLGTLADLGPAWRRFVP